MNYSIRPLQPKDATRMLEWMHDEDVTRYLRLNGKNTTRMDVLRFIQEAQDETVNLHRAVVDCEDTYFGTISLKNIDFVKKEAEYAIAMHPSAIGTGAACAASREIFTLGIQELCLRRIYLNVMAENSRAIAFYRKLSQFGLVEETVTRTQINGAEKTLLWFNLAAEAFQKTKQGDSSHGDERTVD